MKRPPHHLLLLLLILCCTPEAKENLRIDNNIQLLSGELTATSIILQGRFTSGDSLLNFDTPGISGTGCFEISTDSSFSELITTNWQDAHAYNDFIIKKSVDGLNPHTIYFFRIKALINSDFDTVYSSINTFKTLPDRSLNKKVSFAISTGFNYEKYYGIATATENEYPPASGRDHELGFEAFEAVSGLAPDFFIANGDVVYYDKPKNKALWARDLPTMRAKWHRYFAMPRNRTMVQSMPVFYLKDDHDYRFNDCDTTDVKFSEPSHQLGIQVFREQLPVVDPEVKEAKTYRTIRAGNLLQLWFLEGRDFRSPNLQEDTPEKTLWGQAQKEWLKKTLLESDASFKVIITPTPMIGPDDAYKKDNHTNVGGFRSEQQEFFTWLLEHDFLEKNFYFICGDRHWQYHSIHPNGLEEFSSGAFINQNSRPGRKPGDPESTDPEAKIATPFLQYDQFGGGFLYVNVGFENQQPTIHFSFRDTQGKERYKVTKHGAGR